MTRNLILCVGLLLDPTLSTTLQACAPEVTATKSVLFKQPVLSGIAGAFHVPLSEGKFPVDHRFNVILWQPNPNRSDGQLTASAWKAGDMTGFYPRSPQQKHQASFRDFPGASTVQIDGDTIGAYIDSSDLPNGSEGSKMMITPAFSFPEIDRVYPFAVCDEAIVTSLELQVPTARDANKPGNYTYVANYFVFEDRHTRLQISYGVALFHNGAGAPPTLPNKSVLRHTEVEQYDGPSKSFQVGNPLVPGSRVVTSVTGSTLFQTQTWRGWRPFKLAITRQNFENALRSLSASEPGFVGSDEPADYALVEWHLNAELQFRSGPALLGWSVRKISVSLMPTSSLIPIEAN
jgi:hypothetical protein